MAPTEHSFTHFPHWTHSSLTDRRTIRRREVERKKSSQRAEVAAPEPLPDHSQRQNSREEKEDQQVDLEDGQLHRRKDKRIPGKKPLNLREKMIVDIDRGRIKGDDQGPGNEADGVQKIQHLQAHEPRSQGKNKDPVAKSSKGLIIKRLGPFLLPEEDSVEEVDGRPHGAEPSAEEIAEDHHQEENRRRLEAS